MKLCHFSWPWKAGKRGKLEQGKTKSSPFDRRMKYLKKLTVSGWCGTTCVGQKMFLHQNLQARIWKKSHSFRPSTVALSLLETSLWHKQGSRTSWNVFKKTRNRFPSYKQTLMARSLPLSWRKRYMTLLQRFMETWSAKFYLPHSMRTTLICLRIVDHRMGKG